MAEQISNGVPIEIVTATGAGGPRYGIEVEVYDPAKPDQMINVVPGRLAPSCMSEIKGPGAFSFQIQKTDPKLAETPHLLDSRNIVKYRVDGRVIGGGIIGETDYSIVNSGEQAAQNRTVTGEGMRAWLNDMCVVPSTKVNSGSSGNRDFSWASDIGHWYQSRDWTEVTRIQRTVNPNHVQATSVASDFGPFGTDPIDWNANLYLSDPSDPNSDFLPWWVWGRPKGDSPTGYVYFRRAFSIAQETGQRTYTLELAARSQCEVYLDSAQIITSDTTDLNSWTTKQNWSGDLLPGNHVLAIKVWADGEHQAGLVAAMSRNGQPVPGASADDQTTTPAQLLFYTDSGQQWVVNDYPAREPGWNPGELMVALLADATRYDVRFPSLLANTFDQDKDTYGTAWPIRQAWSFGIGTSYTDVVSKIEEVGCELWIDPATMTLNLAVRQGRHRDTQVAGVAPVMFVPGKNVTIAGENQVADIKNGLLIGTSDAVNPFSYLTTEDFDSSDTESFARFGRVIGFLSSGVGADLAGDVAAAIFAEKKLPQSSVTLSIIDTDGARPYVDFFPGDWVLAPDPSGAMVPRRVMSIAVTSDDAGHSQWTVEIDSIYQDLDTRTQQRLANLDNGSLGGTVANSGPSGGSVGNSSNSGTTKGKTGSSGKTGDPGPAGPVGIVPEGNWNSSVAYPATSLVAYNGSSYLARSTSTQGKTPDTEPTVWQLIAAKGAAGSAGAAATPTGRQTFTLTNVSGSGQVTVTGGKAIRVVSMVANTACRVRLYRDASSRAADLPRAVGVATDLWGSVLHDASWGSGDANRTWWGPGRVSDLVAVNGSADTTLYYLVDGGPANLVITYVIED